jgi:hypothetical protein
MRLVHPLDARLLASNKVNPLRLLLKTVLNG